MAPALMKRLGFIFDDHTSVANLNGWPIGFAVNSGATTGGAPTVGLTCAACHSSELTYHGTRLRVDGGQSHVDLDAYKKALQDAIFATGADPARRTDFERRAVALGYPPDRIDAQFRAFYGPVARGATTRAAVAARGTLAGPGRNDAFAVAAQVIFNYGIGVPSNTNRANAPVDYPYLWNIWNLYWVQYNASVRQPMSRNIGESLGFGALTHFLDPATGKLAPLPGRWRTSVEVLRHKLRCGNVVAGALPPAPLSLLNSGNKSKFDAILTRDSAQAATLASRARPFGLTSSFDLYRTVRSYRLAGVLDKIRCPMLIANPEGEQSGPADLTDRRPWRTSP